MIFRWEAKDISAITIQITHGHGKNMPEIGCRLRRTMNGYYYELGLAWIFAGSPKMTVQILRSGSSVNVLKLAFLGQSLRGVPTVRPTKLALS